ncbi:MAG: shikimate kinase [Bacteroidota bacterium]
MPAPPIIIYLWGFMGSGKSFLGKQLAETLGITFVDLDARIESQQASSIAAIFKEKGEGTFREFEQQALHACTEELKQMSVKGNQPTPYAGVISCGGGTPCFYDNVEYMNEQGRTIWLNPPVEVLVERLEHERSHRPVLAGVHSSELKQFVLDKLQQRISCYERAAHIISPARNLQELLNCL